MIDKSNRKKRKRIVETHDDNDSEFEDEPKKKMLSRTKPKYKGKPKKNVLSHHSKKELNMMNLHVRKISIVWLQL